mmetsp:Transcript_22746/g.25662  ORF Transcript_22746/g.25662 Transcript_22746/m.25662 type:complete len:234 (-) Transcript_22746:2448-3149(-)
MAVPQDKIRQYGEAPSFMSRMTGFFKGDSADHKPMINPHESASLLGRSNNSLDNEIQKAGVSYITRSVTDKVTGAFSSASNAVSNTVESGRNLKYAAICFVMGGVFLFLSSMFMPMMVLAPQKFALMFTLGSTCIIMGFAYMSGPTNYLKYLMTKEKIPFSVSYLASMGLTVYSALIWESYVLVLLFCGVQVFAMLWFTCSSLPGGISAMSQCTSFFWSFTFGRLFKRSLLPF